MPSLANVNVRSRVIRALRRAGFVDQPGAKHTIMSHEDGRHTVIPGALHLNQYTLKAIIKQCGLTEKQYVKLYRGKR